jgi:hypothetical protein
MSTDVAGVFFQLGGEEVGAKAEAESFRSRPTVLFPRSPREDLLRGQSDWRVRPSVLSSPHGVFWRIHRSTVSNASSFYSLGIATALNAFALFTGDDFE